MCRIIAIDLTGVALGRPLCFDWVAFRPPLCFDSVAFRPPLCFDSVGLGCYPSFFELEKNQPSVGVYRFDNRKLACPPPPSSDTTWLEPDTVTDIEPETLYSLL